jgi:hypothetical protein
MKRKALELTVIVALLSSLMGVTMPVNLATANPAPLFGWPFEPITTPPTINVSSPVSNGTYLPPNVPLNFRVIKPIAWFADPRSNSAGDVFGNITSVYYTVDGERQSIAVLDLDATFPFKANVPRILSFSIDLNLTAGKHSVQVGYEAVSFFVAGGGGNYGLGSIAVSGNSSSINFTVEQPKLDIVTPESKIYNETSIPLVFSTKQAVSWIGYSLDGKDNVTITGNTTLTGLSNGKHNVTVYANDTYGNMGVPETVTFTISQPFPTASVAAASGASIALIVLSLLVYFKKRKH